MLLSIIFFINIDPGSIRILFCLLFLCRLTSLNARRELSLIDQFRTCPRYMNVVLGGSTGALGLLSVSFATLSLHFVN